MAGKMQIKIITYNIWHGMYLEKVIDFLQQEKADIICLQEVARVGQKQRAVVPQVDLFNQIKTGLGMDGTYQRMCWGTVGRGTFDIGMVVFSAHPMMELTTYRYEREETGEVLEVDLGGKDQYSIPRVLLGVKISAEQRNFWVFNAHHTITPNGGVTEHQLKATRVVKEYLNEYDEYILCGDMNTPYGNKNYDLLSEGLTDLSNPTEPTLHPTIHRVGHKGFHVDYVFAKGDKIKHIKTRIPMIDASDHLPVVVELELI